MTDRALIDPDLSAHPHELVVHRRMRASAQSIYRAWTDEFDSWFAEPGLIRMRAEQGAPFVFQTRHEGSLHSHHGRFLDLVPNELVRLTWITGRAGTDGAETVVTVRLKPAPGSGTDLELTHAGFYDQAGVDRHETAWAEHVLPHLDEVLVSSTVVNAVGTGRAGAVDPGRGSSKPRHGTNSVRVDGSTETEAGT